MGIMSHRSRGADSESGRPMTSDDGNANSDVPDLEGRHAHRGRSHGAHARQTSWPWPRKARMTRPIVLILVVFVTAVFGFLHLFPSVGAYVFGRPSSGRLDKAQLELLNIPTYTDDQGGERRLRLFMPADNPNLDLCKTIMSAVALGYPMPTMLNWRGEFNRPDWHFAGSHIAKLESLLSVIETLLEDVDSGAGEDDIALLVDAYDIWFQLPPSVLVQRFHEMNREADERNRRAWDDALLNNALAPTNTHGKDFPIPPPRQRIVVTTAKECFPDSASGSDPHYDHWPESPLPRDFYGDGTDTVPWFTDPARKWRKVRPRCVNSGLVMGTMGALRDALRRARDKVDDTARRGRQLWSDQALLAEVIGDQEMWREWVRGLAATWDGQGAENDMGGLESEVRMMAEEAIGDAKRFEFGIGLDYRFATIPPTCSSEEDGSIVVTGDRAAVERESEKAGVPGGARVAEGGPAELRGHDGPVPEKGWDEVPLYTDYYFGVSPVGMHHNAYIDGLKDWRREHWWNMTWFHPHLRDLVTEKLKLPSGEAEDSPLATIPSPDKDGEDIVYRAPELKGNKKTATVFEPSKLFTEIDWDGVCQKKGSTSWHENLFGDGKGPLEA